MSFDTTPPRPPKDSPGKVWVQRWQNGKDREECFRQIFLLYSRVVCLYFARKGFSPEESDDLTQEAFLRVYKGLETFRSEARFETWLYQICANLFRNTLRAHSTHKRNAREVSISELLDGQDGDGGGGPDLSTEEDLGALEMMLSEERAQVLHAALQDLPTQMRRCVLLRVDRDLKYKEIADLMRISIETVKAHLFQARQILKVKLADYFTDPDF